MELRFAGFVFEVELYCQMSMTETGEAVGGDIEGQLQGFRRQGVRRTDLGKRRDWFTNEWAGGDSVQFGKF